METLTLSRKELRRPRLLKAACGGRITDRQVADALGLGLRQVRRLRRRFEAGGAAALAHRGRGRPSPRRLAAGVRDMVLKLRTAVYRGFNDTHLTEKPREVHGVAIGRETVRRREGEDSKHVEQKRYRVGIFSESALSGETSVGTFCFGPMVYAGIGGL